MIKEVKIVNIDDKRELWQNLSEQEQLEALDRKYGIGIGEKARRIKLARQIMSSEVVPMTKRKK